MKKIILSTTLMLVFSIFTLSLQAQTTAQKPVKEKAKTEQTSKTNVDKTAFSHAQDANHKCTGDHKHDATHKCTGDHKSKDGKACADKTANKKCCSDKNADGKEAANTKKVCCSEKK